MGNDKITASTAGEIEAANEFYDFDAKYCNCDSKTFIPARIPQDRIEEIRQTAVKAYKAMGCTGLARVDFFLCDDGTVVLNEINTMPGHTSISMYPKLMQHEGMTFEQQEDNLIKLALERAGVDYE
jgi:D-alanine-D-alanine ligase